MKRLLILLASYCFLFFILNSCKRWEEKDLEIIERIRIGTSLDVFHQQLKNLEVQDQEFYTSWYIEDASDGDKYKVRYSVSDIFDYPEFDYGPYGNHNSVIVPVTLPSTDNVVGVYVLLGNFSFAQTGFFQNLTESTGVMSFEHFIHIEAIDKIKNVLSTKYGKPSSERFSSRYDSFLQFQGNKLERVTDNSRIGRIIRWETNTMVIELFEGLLSPINFANPDGYNKWLGGREQPDSLVENYVKRKNYQRCYEVSYLKYDLKDEIIESLELNDPAI